MGSSWEPVRKRIVRPDSGSLQYSLYEGVGRSAWAQKRSCTSCLSRLKANSRVVDTLPSTALAWHPVHRILVSGGSEGAILHWDSSSPTPGTPQYPTAPSLSGAATSPASYTALLAPAPQIPPRATLPQAHDSNVLALVFHPLFHMLVSASCDPMTRFWARERPVNAAPACLCPARRDAYRCGPRRRRRRRARGRGRCTCCVRLRQLCSVAVPGTGGEGRNSADTVGHLWVARTAESVPGRTTIPYLDSVAAAVRCPASAVVGGF
jgi:hypothetical protein